MAKLSDLCNVVSSESNTGCTRVVAIVSCGVSLGQMDGVNGLCAKVIFRELLK